MSALPDAGPAAQPTTTAPLSAALPHLIVAHHLRAHGFTSTLNSFLQDAAQAGIALPAGLSGTAADGQAQPAPPAGDSAALIPAELELPNLLASFKEHQRILAAEAAARAAREARRERQLTERASLLALALPGPAKLPFALSATFRTLHASNVLSIALVQLPQRRFSTATARFETTLRPALATTAADRRVVISDIDSGEMLECLEGAQGTSAGHRAAVLCTAQNPALPRELVSTSMDSSVLVWDLLAGGGAPVQVLRDHTRFVVRAAYSQDGRFLATAGYDRKVQIYQRQPLPAASNAEAEADTVDEDESDPVPIQSPFKLIKTVETKVGNPEAILFVKTRLLPVAEDAVEEGTEAASLAPTERTWLAFSCRGECHINYIALPRTEETAMGTQEDPVSAKESTHASAPEPEDFTLVKCNTNENVDDWHVSYSLLCLAAHPSGKYLSAHTGDHTRPSSTTSTGETYLAPPKILLVQPLRAGRVHTLFLPAAHAAAAAALGGGTSLSPSPRHAWVRPGGQALWVAGEDGRVRLLDVQCEGEDGTNARMRAEVWTQGRMDDADVDVDADADADEDASVPGAMRRLRLQDAEQEASALWSRGGNTVIKDIAVIDEEGSVATCGFDHTVRIVKRRSVA